jgi:hypothetical protein
MKGEIQMADWQMTGTYFKSCNCDPGCPCDFMSEPTHHKCEGVLGMNVDQGHFDSVSLDGVKWAVAYHWPGPLHEGNGTVKAYFDPSTSEEQLNGLGQILTGQAGGGWFELVASIVSEMKDPAIAPIEFDIQGARGEVRIGDVIENRFAAIPNPVTGDDTDVYVRIRGGLEYSPNGGEARIVRSETMRSTDELAFDYTGCDTSLVEHQTFASNR